MIVVSSKFAKLIIMGVILVGHAFFSGCRSSEYYYYRAFERSRTTDYKGAIADLDKAINADSEKWYYFALRGHIEYLTGANQRAIEDLNKALELNSSVAIVLLERGKVSIALGDYHSATSDLDRSIETDPGNGLSYIYRGYAKYMGGQMEEGLEDLDKAVELWPYGEADLIRGMARIGHGDYLGGLQDLFAGIRKKQEHTLTTRSGIP